MKPPEPGVVWLVREGDPTSIEGTISLENDVLRFVPAHGEGERIDIPLSAIGRARRRRATPVLDIWLRGGEGKMHLYFARPPPISGENTSGLPPVLRPRGLQRSAAAMGLRASGKLLRNEIEAWVRALRE